MPSRAVQLVLVSLLPAYEVVEAEEPPDYEARRSDFFQCDRQCRWTYGFYNRTIVGDRGGFWSRNKCKCYRLNSAGDDAEHLGDVDSFSEKEFLKDITWSGDFTCPLVCARGLSGRSDDLETLEREEAVAAGREMLHCGECAVCSRPEDLVVLPLTRKWITQVMTSVATKFASPVGHRNVSRLQEQLTEKGLNFSTTRADGNQDMPTCMDCWTDNIMCTRRTCISACWIKFFDASNPESDIENCGFFDFHCRCLRCDEQYCGAPFIKCAGANRRSTGVVSDIKRPGNQVCPVGLYSDVADGDLPTLDMPDVLNVRRIVLTAIWSTIVVLIVCCCCCCRSRSPMQKYTSDLREKFRQKSWFASRQSQQSMNPDAVPMAQQEEVVQGESPPPAAF